MRDQTASPINFLRVVLKPKPLLFLVSLFYFLSALYGLGRLSVYWADATVMMLAALALWFSKSWSYVISALLSSPVFYQLAFGFPFESVEHWWMWIQEVALEDLGFIALAGIVFCYAVACFLLMFSRKRLIISETGV